MSQDADILLKKHTISYPPCDYRKIVRSHCYCGTGFADTISIEGGFLMRTFIDEAEVKRIVKYVIHEGTPSQLKELTQLVHNRRPWRYKKESLTKIIANMERRSRHD